MVDGPHAAAARTDLGSRRVMSARTRSSFARALFVVPALVLVISFIGVCVQAGTPWPWSRVVHEDGHRTLLQTIFYFEHATRELLLDGVLAMFVAGAVRYFHPLPRGAGDSALWKARWRMG